MSDKRTYYANGGSTTGSTGFTNYFPGSSERVAATLETISKELPNSIVINGDDDWYAPLAWRPQTWINKLGIESLANFHNGISGISKSGIIVDEENFEKLKVAFKTEFGEEIESVKRLKIYDLRTVKNK